jgi:hypothetical protein
MVAATGAQAADLSAPVSAGGYKDVCVPEIWGDAGDMFVRVRAEAILATNSTSDWKLNGTSNAALAGAIFRPPEPAYLEMPNSIRSSWAPASAIASAPATYR